MTTLTAEVETPVALGKPVWTLNHLLKNADALDVMLQVGFEHAVHRHSQCPSDVVDTIMMVRNEFGFTSMSDLLTPPNWNVKLEAASVPTYGLTLAHADISGYELCSWRGDCTKVCVLNNGNGRYDSVRTAWKARTRLFAKHPNVAMYRMGWELGRAARKHGEILFRPNVNSDLSWHDIAPSLGGLSGVTSYGYTKNPAVLSKHDDLWSSGFHYAYSWSEKSSVDKVRGFLCSSPQASVAVVTSRRKGAPVDADRVRAFFGVPSTVRVLDADATDEWMLVDGPVIGDLSAKGKARELIGVSDFVAHCY